VVDTSIRVGPQANAPLGDSLSPFLGPSVGPGMPVSRHRALIEYRAEGQDQKMNGLTSFLGKIEDYD